MVTGAECRQPFNLLAERIAGREDSGTGSVAALNYAIIPRRISSTVDAGPGSARSRIAAPWAHGTERAVLSFFAAGKTSRRWKPISFGCARSLMPIADGLVVFHQ